MSINEGSEHYISKAIEMGVKPALLERFIALLATATARKNEDNRDEVVSNLHVYTYLLNARLLKQLKKWKCTGAYIGAANFWGQPRILGDLML